MARGLSLVYRPPVHPLAEPDTRYPSGRPANASPPALAGGAPGHLRPGSPRRERAGRAQRLADLEYPDQSVKAAPVQPPDEGAAGGPRAVCRLAVGPCADATLAPLEPGA